MPCHCAAASCISRHAAIAAAIVTASHMLRFIYIFCHSATIFVTVATLRFHVRHSLTELQLLRLILCHAATEAPYASWLRKAQVAILCRQLRLPAITVKAGATLFQRSTLKAAIRCFIATLPESSLRITLPLHLHSCHLPFTRPSFIG